MKYIVDSKLLQHGDAVLAQTISLDHGHSPHPAMPQVEELSRRVIDFCDAGVREALVKMGWTPPPPDWKPTP